MNDEIKEILSKMERLIVYGQYNAYYNLKEQILDYITNLQQENEKIRKMNMHEHKYGSDMEEKYLIEKNKNDRAVEYIKKHRAMYFPSGCGDVIKYVPLEFKRDYYENSSTFTETENLLDILNGRSDE